jgi:hypothetical protein
MFRLVSPRVQPTNKCNDSLLVAMIIVAFFEDAFGSLDQRIISCFHEVASGSLDGSWI